MPGQQMKRLGLGATAPIAIQTIPRAWTIPVTRSVFAPTHPDNLSAADLGRMRWSGGRRSSSRQRG
jgi:hypothetical protein